MPLIVNRVVISATLLSHGNGCPYEVPAAYLETFDHLRRDVQANGRSDEQVALVCLGGRSDPSTANRLSTVKGAVPTNGSYEVEAPDHCIVANSSTGMWQ